MSDIVILSGARTAIGAFQGALKDLPAPALGARAIRRRSSGRASSPHRSSRSTWAACSPPGSGRRRPARRRSAPAARGDRRAHRRQGLRLRHARRDDRRQRPALRRLPAGGRGRHGEHEPGALPRARRPRRPAPRPRQVPRLDDPRRALGPLQRPPHGQLRRALRPRVRHLARGAGRLRRRELPPRARRPPSPAPLGDEIVAVELPQKKGGPLLVDRDEEPFKSDLARIGGLRPAFEKDGTVTAGNASKINDGAAALVLDHRRARRRAWASGRSARIVAHSSAAQQPEWFTTAPVAAVRRVLERARTRRPADIDLWEINEAFAVVALACMQRPRRSPPSGSTCAAARWRSAIPIGASGARILVTLLSALEERGLRRGCAAICIGGGEATAMIVERID